MAGNTVIGGGRLGSGLRLALWGGAAALLLIPAVASQLSTEMDWGPFDFLLLGVMLALVCGAVELGAWLSNEFWYRAGVAVAAGASFLLVMINLAVGMIGSEDNSYNLYFGGVFAIGLVGALLARLQPRELSWVLGAMAIAQAGIAINALLAGVDPRGATMSGLFAGFWLLSGALFWKAAR